MGGDSAYLFYLLVLLVFIGSYFLYDRRQKLSQTVQQALIWLGIFMLAIIAYGFRDVLNSELFPREAQQIDGDTIALNRGPGGSFITTVDINGQSIPVLVDTGATGVVLSRSDATRIGLDPDTLNYTQLARTANGTVRTAPVVLNELNFGNFTDRNVRATVNEGEMDTSLLGMDYLGRFERIEIVGDRMILTRRNGG